MLKYSSEYNIRTTQGVEIGRDMLKYSSEYNIRRV